MGAAMTNDNEKGLAWQVGVWDRMADVYQQEIDKRFSPVVEHVVTRANLGEGSLVLDLGTGTGAVAIVAAQLVGEHGHVIAVDISQEMLEIAKARVKGLTLSNVDFSLGQAEAIPAEDNSLDAVIASLSLMYVIDRNQVALEISRVLKPGGRFVASVWGGADEADIVRFQQTAGSFAPKPPVAGVGPGALADPNPFLSQLRDSGLIATSEHEVTEFEFGNFQDAWEALAGVTTASLAESVRNEAKLAVTQAMWADETKSRVFRNSTNLIIATKPD